MDYLKQNCKVIYTNLLTSGRLNVYLANIDRQAQERIERLIEDMLPYRHSSIGSILFYKVIRQIPVISLPSFF